MLLEKEIDQPFPWVCNLHDLENIVQINTYLKKKTENFIEYILWRIDNHRAIISSDELDVIQGFYFDKKAKVAKDKTLFFWPTGPSLIDKIYFEKKGIPYLFAPLDNAPRRNIKIGRMILAHVAVERNTKNVVGNNLLLSIEQGRFCFIQST